MRRLVVALILLIALAVAVFLLARPSAQASPDATITVTSTADSGPGTLRQALLDALSGDTINFDPTVFPPGSPATITLSSTLPTLSTGNVTVDGSAAGVIVDGVSKAFNCFLISGEGSDGNTIKGLQIKRCLTGVRIESGADTTTVGGTTSSERNVISGNSTGVLIRDSGTTSNAVKGNYIGTDVSGNVAAGNVVGVSIDSGAWNNVIGGPSDAERNVISGSVQRGVRINAASHNTIIGNYIGTNAAGDAALPNQFEGVDISVGAQDNTVGGPTEAERNVISGNNHYGVNIFSATSNTVIGNYIGTNAAGTAALRNNWGGVNIWAQNNTVDRNLISGNSLRGVCITGSSSSGNRVIGNYIGTNAAGGAALRNGGNGVDIEWGAQNNIIGGPTSGERNVISGNLSHGVSIVDEGTSGNRVIGNYIGINAAGDGALPNSYFGVQLAAGAQNNTIGSTAAGEGNAVAYNTESGVAVYGATTIGNTITGNSIHSNGGQGIDNFEGGNAELAPPVIDTVGGSVSGHTSPKCYPCTVEVFSDSEDEGRIYHGSAATNDDATGTWSYLGAVTGPNITATITHADGNTSEFSAPLAYYPPVGGIAELPGASNSAGRNYVAVALAGLAVALVAVGASGWYARRRWQA